jgi:MFS family permease
VFSFLGRIMWGILADRWGPKPADILAVLPQSLMMIWRLGTIHPLRFFLFAFFWGIGYGGATPPSALFVQDDYELQSVGGIDGGIMMLAAMGMAGGGHWAASGGSPWQRSAGLDAQPGRRNRHRLRRPGPRASGPPAAAT